MINGDQEKNRIIQINLKAIRVNPFHENGLFPVTIITDQNDKYGIHLHRILFGNHRRYPFSLAFCIISYG